MTRALAVLALLTLAGCQQPALVTLADAGELEVSFVLPTMDDDSNACDASAPVPRVPPTAPMMAHVAWISTLRGGAAGRDSVQGAPGDTVRFVFAAPAGDYRVTAHAADAGGAGCPVEAVMTVTARPGKVRFVP